MTTMRLGWIAGVAIATVPVAALVAYAQSDWTLPFVQSLESQTRLSVQTQSLGAELTRIEFARWLAEFFGYSADQAEAIPLRDLNTSDPDYWTAQAVLQAGVMRSYENGDFRPGGNLTKLEALAIMVRAAGVTAPTEDEVQSWMALYSDANAVPGVGAPFIAMGGSSQILLNVPDPAFIRPDAILTRGEGAAMLHQALVYRQRIPALNAPVAQLSPTPPARPELSAVRIVPEAGILPAGAQLTIEAQGTPGGSAIAYVGTTVQVAMRETESGVYRGEFTPTSVDFIPTPAIAIELAANGETTRWQQQFPQLTIGRGTDLSAPPPISNLFSPPPSQPFIPPPTFNPPISQPIAPPVYNPSFTAIRITPPQGNLVEGDILTVAIQAEPGGTAEFELPGLAQSQAMREIQTGIYEGTYVVAPNDTRQNPDLRVVFSRNGGSVVHSEILPHFIDGSVSTRPTVAAPTQPPAFGSTTAPLIFGIDNNAVGRTLRVNDLLEVQLRGDRGGTATFEILEVTPPIPMQETSPGVYTGRVSIGPNTPSIENGLLKVTLSNNGQQTERTSGDRLSISP